MRENAGAPVGLACCNDAVMTDTPIPRTASPADGAATVRRVRRGDEPAVRTVHLVSFPGPAEADLVDGLRVAGDVVLELVATRDNVVVGSAVFSRARIEDTHGVTAVAALGPVSVSPSHRRIGIAASLITAGIAELDRYGDGRPALPAVFVLGDPGYYGRFGFEAARAAPFTSPWAGPYLMARATDDLPTAGTLHHAPAFNDL